MVNYGETLARKVRARTLSKTVGHADLTAAATTETLQFDATEVMKFVVVGFGVKLATPFTGGSVSALDVTLGTAADPVALISACDILSAAVDGYASAMTLGKAPFKQFSAATTFDLDFTATGDNVVNLTAGAMTVEIYILELVD